MDPPTHDECPPFHTNSPDIYTSPHISHSSVIKLNSNKTARPANSRRRRARGRNPTPRLLLYVLHVPSFSACVLVLRLIRRSQEGEQSILSGIVAATKAQGGGDTTELGFTKVGAFSMRFIYSARRSGQDAFMTEVTGPNGYAPWTADLHVSGCELLTSNVNPLRPLTLRMWQVFPESPLGGASRRGRICLPGRPRSL